MVYGIYGYEVAFEVVFKIKYWKQPNKKVPLQDVLTWDD